MGECIYFQTNEIFLNQDWRDNCQASGPLLRPCKTFLHSSPPPPIILAPMSTKGPTCPSLHPAAALRCHTTGCSMSAAPVHQAATAAALEAASAAAHVLVASAAHPGAVASAAPVEFASAAHPGAVASAAAPVAVASAAPVAVAIALPVAAASAAAPVAVANAAVLVAAASATAPLVAAKTAAPLLVAAAAALRTAMAAVNQAAAGLPSDWGQPAPRLMPPCHAPLTWSHPRDAQRCRMPLNLHTGPCLLACRLGLTAAAAAA